MSNTVKQFPEFRVLPVTLFQSNCILVFVPGQPDVIIVDPGGEAKTITRTIEEHKLTPRAILLTHGHVDHVSGATPLKKRFDVPVYLHPEDKPMAQQIPNQCRLFGIPLEKAPEVDHPLAEGQTLTFGEISLEVLHTPGHSPGSVCFLVQGEPQVLLSGDLLFAGSIGRTDLPGGNGSVMQRSLDRVSKLAPGIRVIPGHGPETTIGREKRGNPFLTGGMYI